MSDETVKVTHPRPPPLPTLDGVLGGDGNSFLHTHGITMAALVISALGKYNMPGDVQQEVISLL